MGSKKYILSQTSKGAAMKHIAVIPARKGSMGVVNKNQLLFNKTADFIEASRLYDEILVTTNDPVIQEMAQKRGYRVRVRPDTLAGSYDPIKPSFTDLIENMDVPKDAYLWLFYLTHVFRDHKDHEAAHRMVIEENSTSLMLFLPAKTHPFRCWGQDPKTGEMYKFIEDNRVSRQEYPSAWWNNHYLCCVRADSLDTVNNNLIGPKTTPIYFTEAQGDRLVDIDEYADIVNWSKRYPEDYAKWWKSLPPEKRVGPEPA